MLLRRFQTAISSAALLDQAYRHHHPCCWKNILHWGEVSIKLKQFHFLKGFKLVNQSRLSRLQSAAFWLLVTPAAVNGRLEQQPSVWMNLGCGAHSLRVGWRRDPVTQDGPDDSCLLWLTQTAVVSHLCERRIQRGRTSYGETSLVS